MGKKKDKDLRVAASFSIPAELMDRMRKIKETLGVDINWSRVVREALWYTVTQIEKDGKPESIDERIRKIEMVITKLIGRKI